MRTVLASALICVLAASPALAQSSCDSITRRALGIRTKLDLLKLDHPAAFRWMCGSLKPSLQGNPAPDAVIPKLTAAQGSCAADMAYCKSTLD
jgi:hypothetical protein